MKTDLATKIFTVLLILGMGITVVSAVLNGGLLSLFFPVYECSAEGCE